MRRVAVGEASNFDGVLHKGLPLRVLSKSDLLLKDSARAQPPPGLEDALDDTFDPSEDGARDPDSGPEEDEFGEEAQTKKLCKYLSMAMSCAMELGDQDLEDEISNLHTRCEAQYGVDTYE